MFHDRSALVSPMADTPRFEVAEVGDLCVILYYFGNDTLPILRDLLTNDDARLRQVALARHATVAENYA